MGFSLLIVILQLINNLIMKTLILFALTFGAAVVVNAQSQVSPPHPPPPPPPPAPIAPREREVRQTSWLCETQHSQHLVRCRCRQHALLCMLWRRSVRLVNRRLKYTLYLG